MKRRRGARWAPGAAALALVLAAGCSAISGLGGLHFDESTAGGGAGGAGAGAGSSGSIGGSGSACRVVADCGTRDCLDVACKGGACVFDPSAAGTTCASGTCDGHGSCVGCVGPGDCPTAPVCQTAACISGACTFEDAAADTSCNAGAGHYCDGQGNCVACNTAIECGAGEVCTNHVCQDLCADMIRDNGETDVDCGGPCARCADGKKCTVAMDCISSFCVDGVCCNNACGGACESCNGALSPGLCQPLGTDVDDPGICDATHGNCGASGGCSCGQTGSCLRADGAFCIQNGECASGNCKNDICKL
jgi:hypothetical protein